MKFSLLFLGYHDKEAIPSDTADRVSGPNPTMGMKTEVDQHGKVDARVCAMPCPG